MPSPIPAAPPSPWPPRQPAAWRRPASAQRPPVLPGPLLLGLSLAWGAAAVAQPVRSPPPGRAAALVQLTGAPLAGGVVSGAAQVPLVRAAGGDTPVLAFQLPSGQGDASSATLRLLVDTGASSTMVTPDLVRRLALRALPLAASDFEVAGGGEGCDRLAPARTLLPPLRLVAAGSGGVDRSGGLLLRGVEALVLPVAALPAGVDGVLGVPTLRRLPIAIDPRAGLVSLGTAALKRLETSGASPLGRISLRWRRGVPLLELETASGRVDALADSGAEGLFLRSSLAARLQPLDAGQVLRLVGVCGEQRVIRRRFSGLRLPLQAAPRPLDGIVIDNPIFGQLGVAAIVGQEWLRDQRQLWRLDFDPPQLLLW